MPMIMPVVVPVMQQNMTVNAAKVTKDDSISQVDESQRKTRNDEYVRIILASSRIRFVW